MPRRFWPTVWGGSLGQGKGAPTPFTRDPPPDFKMHHVRGLLARGNVVGLPYVCHPSSHVGRHRFPPIDTNYSCLQAMEYHLGARANRTSAPIHTFPYK